MMAGKLREQITVQEKNPDSQNTFGELPNSWASPTTIGTYWADVRAMVGRELQAAQETFAEARWKVLMRYQPDIKREHRILWGTRTLDILDAEDPDQRGRELLMYCREVVE